MRHDRSRLALMPLLALLWLAPATAQDGKPASPLAFEVTFTDAVAAGPISARVYVMLGPPLSQREPRTGPDWFAPSPFFAVEARDWKPRRAAEGRRRGRGLSGEA